MTGRTDHVTLALMRLNTSSGSFAFPFYPAGAHTHSSCLGFTFFLCAQLSQAEFSLRGPLLCTLLDALHADA